MSDIHVLEGNFAKDNGSGSYKVVFHIPGVIPNYPADAARISVIPDLDVQDATEYAAIQAGTVHEFVEDISFNEGVSGATMLAEVRARWAELQAEKATQLTNEYKYYKDGYANA